jgi:hypothetical protein
VGAGELPSPGRPELLALREQVNKLMSEKAALQEKNKKISKAKKG